MYASTTKSQLNLNNRRVNEANPTLTYPDISFAVENFEEAFESLVSSVQPMALKILTHLYLEPLHSMTCVAGAKDVLAVHRSAGLAT